MFLIWTYYDNCIFADKPRNTNIEIVGQSREVAAGRSVIFKCNTDANPPPRTFEWFPPRTSSRNTSENILELKNVQSADQGCYSCRASNSIGSEYSSSSLCITVLCK